MHLKFIFLFLDSDRNIDDSSCTTHFFCPIISRFTLKPHSTDKYQMIVHDYDMT